MSFPLPTPKVSVILPTYKVEPFFAQCIESVMASTLKEIEIIPVDDGSPDACGAMMDAYAQRDARIRPIHQTNGGYGKAVNAGLAVAQGAYIAIIETDDVMKPTFLETLYQLAEKHQADVAKADFYYYRGGRDVIPRRRLRHVAPEGEVFTLDEKPELLIGHVSIWSALYRRDFLESNAIRFEETAGASYQDGPFAYRVYAAGAKIVLSHQHGVYYRMGETHQSSSINNQSLGLMQIIHQSWKAREILREAQRYEAVKEAFFRQAGSPCFLFFAQLANEHRPVYFEALQALFRQGQQDGVTFQYFSTPSDTALLEALWQNNLQAAVDWCIQTQQAEALRYRHRQRWYAKFTKHQWMLIVGGRVLLNIHTD
ncbi:MAG: glycosyltransferase [Vampirovibrionales bacterium]